MSTLLHLRRARAARDPQHIRVLPRVSNQREVGDGGLTWIEVAIAVIGVGGWAVLCVVTL